MTPAEELASVGGGHAVAAKLLIDAAGGKAFNGVTSASIFLLIGNALEVTLKSAYLHFGGDIEHAKFKIGHDLKAALAAALAQGFTDEDSALEKLVEMLAESHKAHFFRYLGRPNIVMPDPSPCHEILDRHVRHVLSIVFPTGRYQR